jgi:hypothetical protein
MRLLTVATLLAAVFAVSSAFAQTDHVHHKYCLRTGGGVECAYDTIKQCVAAKHGQADSCVRNSPTRDQH